MPMFKFDLAVTNVEPDDSIVDVIDCPGLVGYVGRSGEGGAADIESVIGRRDVIRRGDVGFFDGSASRRLYLAVGSKNLDSGVKVRVRIDYDVVTLSTAEQAALAYKCC